MLPQKCKKGTIPHLATITRLCILAGVQGIWAEEETCPKVSPLTLTGVKKGPKNIKMEEMEIVEATEEPEEEEHEQLGMEKISREGQLPIEDEMQSRRSSLIHSPPNVRKTFSELAECSKRNQGNIEIMEILVLMEKEMEEREKIWEQQQTIIEEFLEANFRRREQQWEQILKQRDEEWTE